MTEKEQAFIESRIKLYRRLSYECTQDALSSNPDDYEDVIEYFYTCSRLYDERVECLESLLEDLSFLPPS